MAKASETELNLTWASGFYQHTSVASTAEYQKAAATHCYEQHHHEKSVLCTSVPPPERKKDNENPV